MTALYTFARVTGGALLRLAWRPTVEGLEHVPRHGGAIIAGNHLSVADELFLGLTVPRHVAFWAKAEYFRGTGPRGWWTRAMVTGVGAIPVERAGGRAALSAFDAAVPVLRAGGLVAVYPEGTRSPDGRLYRGRTGVARLALAAGVPVIPLGTVGTDLVQPIGARVPRLPFMVPSASRAPGVDGSGAHRKRPEVIVRFGKPLDFTGRDEDYASFRMITDEVIMEIQRLTGQDYVPEYAPNRRSLRS